MFLISFILIFLSFCLVIIGFIEKNISNTSVIECGFSNTTFSIGFISVQFIFILIIFVLFDVELIILLRVLF